MMHARNFRLFSLRFLLLGVLLSVLATVSLAAPPAPTGLYAYASTSSQIYVAWDEVKETTNYLIQWRVAGMQNWFQEAGYPYTSWQHVELKCSTEYTYRVAAVRLRDGQSPWTEPVSATTLECPPGPETPKNFTAKAVSKTQIDLKWNDVLNKTGFEIEHSTNNVNWSLLQTLNPYTTQTSHAGLTCGQTHFYRLRAVNDNGKSDYASASAKTHACGPIKTELLYNGSFEINIDDNPKIPDGWTAKGPMLQDKLITKNYGDGSYVNFGERAWLFRSPILIPPNDRLYQGVDISGVKFAVGDELRVHAMINRVKGGIEKKIVWVTVVYSDGTKSDMKMASLGQKGVGFVSHSHSMVLERTDITAIAVRIAYNKVNSKLSIDDVSLQLIHPVDNLSSVPDTPEASQTGGDWLPLPAAPADMRSN